MTVINTNLASLRTQSALGQVGRAVSQSMQQLSTGQRVNSAADDAAGLAIGSKMTAQIQGMDQALRNVMDASAMLQTADGAAAEVTSMLQRMRELAVQSLNDTLDEKDRLSLDQEFQQLKKQIDQIATATEWNGQGLLNLHQRVLETAMPALRAGQGPLDTSQLPTGHYDLYINGVQVTIPFVQDELPDARLGKIVNAIQANRSLHGAVADLSGDGSLVLSTPDGRDLAVWYDSSVPGLSAASFGLGRDGAVAQINEIRLVPPPAADPVENRQSTYVEYSLAGQGPLALTSLAQPDTSAGAISVVGGTVYRGLGATAQAFGEIDSVRNGQGGQPLRINFLLPFVNGDFESGTVGSTTVDGWSLYPQRVKLDGSDSVAGFPTPVDNRPESTFYSDISTSYTAVLSDASVAPGSTKSMMLKSVGLVVDAGGVSHGPYIVSDPLYVPAGEAVSFKWRATGDTDTFDVYAYLLNTETGAVTTLLNRTGTSLTDSTSWTTVSSNVGSDGIYRFVFVSGSFDFTNGRATGATLFLDDVQVSGSPPASAPTASELNALFGLVQTQPSGSLLQASFVLQGQSISSGPSASAEQALAQLRDRIDVLSSQGLLSGVSAELIQGRLRLTSIYPGEPMSIAQLTVSDQGYVMTNDLVRASQPGIERADGIAAATAQSTGAQVTQGKPADSESLRTAGRLRYQVGANQGQVIEYVFSDFTGAGGLLDALTWDVSDKRLARATLVAGALGQPVLDDQGQMRSHIGRSDAAGLTLDLIDRMMAQVDARRALLGSALNRLQAAGNNLSVGSLHQSQSRSQIDDTDYAKSASTLAKSQIVQNAASAMLAQANMRGQDVIKLLKP